MKKIITIATVIIGSGLAGAAVLPANAVENSNEQHQRDPQADESWTLVWSDEFDGDAIDFDKWRYEVDCWGGGNDERQCYTARPENSFVSEGVLSIVARQEWMQGSALPKRLRITPEDEDKLAVKPFSSAKLTTQGNADWLYGRFEVRAKLPEGQGVWPAIWMLPASESYGGWAASGEIDIVEAVNLGASCRKCENKIENRIYGTLHFGGQWPENVYKGKETALPESEDGFHTFAIEWSEGEISWFVDDIKYSTLTSRSWRSSTRLGRKSKHAPFDHPFYLILNLAVGGHLAEDNNDKGVSLEGYPKTMQVDWVRVYQRAGANDPAGASQPSPQE
ncbi:MAG: glycoside hydrolase family 16 protein [Pseudomonadota bacterium]